MTLKFIGKKVGMTQLFDQNGQWVPCTVIHAEPNVVTQIKHKDGRDGYNAVQLGKKARRKKNIAKPQQGHFAKANVEVCEVLAETQVEDVTEYSLGQEINVSHFANIKHVDVTGISKGKGYQGMIKLHRFSGGPAAHGSGFHRHAGSTGMRTTPGRCLPGGKRASQMGRDQITAQNLEVVEIDAENHLIFVKGTVPGNRGAFVFIKQSRKAK